MAGAPVNWFLILTTVLQLVLAARLAYERPLWVRLVALLCALNGLLLPADLAGEFLGLPDLALLVDGPTGSILLLAALALPGPRPRFAAAAVGLAIWHGVAAALYGLGVLGPESFVIAYQGVPVTLGYSAFLWLVAGRFVSGASQFPAGTAWVVAAFVIRIVEFPVRYLPRIRPTGVVDPLWFFLAGIALVAILVGLVAFRLVTSVRNAGSRELVLVAGAMALGGILGLSDLVAGAEHAPETEIVRRLSLVLFRPVLLAIGILGPLPAVGLLVPLLSAAVGTAVSLTFLSPLFPTSASGLATIAATALGGASALLGWYFVPRSAAAPSQNAPSPSWPAGVERWKILLVALARAREEDLSEEHARARLAERVGVEVRNLHRLAIDANDVGEAQGRGVLVEWKLARGAGNQQKYFYWLTASGRELAADLAKEWRRTGAQTDAEAQRSLAGPADR